MANRLEAVCWDDATDDIAPELKGLPFVKVNLAGLGNGSDTTNSLLEFHRLNSPYIMSGVTKDGIAFADVLKPELGMVRWRRLLARRGPRQGANTEGTTAEAPAAATRNATMWLAWSTSANWPQFASSTIRTHSCMGVFLEKIAGRLRHPRALSAFIEASGVGRADSGGVKFDRALPKPSVAGVDAKGGYGNVPFHRTEFTAKSITAFFSLDLAQIRGYGLSEDAAQLLSRPLALEGAAVPRLQHAIANSL